MLDRLRSVSLGMALLLLPLYAHAQETLRVDVNTASQGQLEVVKHLGPALAERILQARQQGPFRSYADLQQRVKGIGAAKLAQLRAAGLNVNEGTYLPRSEPLSDQTK